MSSATVTTNKPSSVRPFTPANARLVSVLMQVWGWSLAAYVFCKVVDLAVERTDFSAQAVLASGAVLLATSVWLTGKTYSTIWACALIFLVVVDCMATKVPPTNRYDGIFTLLAMLIVRDKARIRLAASQEHEPG